MPEGAKAMETPSLGMCTLTLLPDMTCSTMACILPERWKKGRYCLALREVAGGRAQVCGRM